MGALANLPVGMAPGMGLNAYVCACVMSPRGALILPCALVHILGRWLPRQRFHNLQGSTSGCVS